MCPQSTLRTEDSSGDTCAKRWQTSTQVSPIHCWESIALVLYTGRERRKATDVYCGCTNAWLQLFPTNWWRLWFNKVYICIPLHSRCTPLIGSAAWTRAGKTEHCLVQHGFHVCANVQCSKTSLCIVAIWQKNAVSWMKRTTKQTKENKREWGREKGGNISAVFSTWKHSHIQLIATIRKNLSSDLPLLHNSQNELWRCFQSLESYQSASGMYLLEWTMNALE